jgi:hypothetical protein
MIRSRTVEARAFASASVAGRRFWCSLLSIERQDSGTR